VATGVRERLTDRAGALGIALIVTVLAAAGIVIAGRGGSSPAPTPPTAAAKTTPLAFTQPLRPTEVLSGDAASFEHTTGGWTSSNATVSRSTASPHGGAGALQADVNGSGGRLTVWSPQVPAKAQDRYVASTYVRAITAARQAHAELRFINSSGTVTDTEVGELMTDSASQWLQLPPVAAISPIGTVKVQLGVTFPVVGAGAMHLTDSATIDQTPGGSAPVVGPLTTRGNQILDGHGKPLILRGLQRFGLEGGTKTPLPTNAEIGQLKLWGANEVRISLGEQKWLATNCHYEADYPQIVDRVVRWVTSRGMVALINLHFATTGDCGTPGLTTMADSSGAITFWQEVASRYRNNPLVAFDLFNEPEKISNTTWLYGGFIVNGGNLLDTAGMQVLYQTVRATGAQNLVVISGLDFADHPPTEPVEGFNIAYGAHAYQCTESAPPDCKTPDPYDAGVPLHHWLTFADTYPLIVTEFGFPDHGVDGTYNANVVAYADQHDWGWSGFAWDGGTDGLFDLVQAHPASDGKTIEPNAAGMPLLAGFALNWPSPTAYKQSLPSPIPTRWPPHHKPHHKKTTSP
jgi:endoglucanase